VPTQFDTFPYTTLFRSKITLNMGVGEAKTDSKAMDAAIEELSTIAGQRAQVRKATKSIAQFKLREGMAVGARVTLRGPRMYEFRSEEHTSELQSRFDLV